MVTRSTASEVLGEVVAYRELLRELTARDLLLRYKQTAMGVGWALLAPLLNMIVFSVVFTRVAPLDTGFPYPVFAYCGLLPWTFFASALKFASISLTANQTLVTKVYFPRELLPLSAVLASLVDLAAGGVVLVVLLAWYRVPVGPAALLLPAVIAVEVAFTAGAALLFALASLFYRDVKYLVDLLLGVWMLATSVVYPVERVGGKLAALLRLNPMTPIIDAWRATLLRGEAPAAWPFLYATASALAVLAASAYVFHRAEPRFAERI
jgi:ABC-type polysaccharide/polyol phosphate export permease